MTMPDLSPAADPAAAEAADGQRTYYLIDGSGFIFRAFHGLPMMTRPGDGTPVNAVYGFSTMLLKLMAEVKADHIAVIFDAARENFRNAIYADYKANRSDPPEELIPQFALIREAVRAFNVPMVEMDGYEADDLIAAYCRKARAEGAKAVIVSSDKDLMQLIGDGVTMLDPMKNRAIDIAEVREKFGVDPDRVVDVQALAGDSVDNVPGVPGIGIKTAAQLIADYGDLETLLARAGEIKQPKRRQSLLDHAEMARISRQLVKLDETVEPPLSLDDMAIRLPDPSTLLGFLQTQGFRSLITRLRKELDGAEGLAEATAPTAEEVAADWRERSVPPPQPETVDYTLVQDEATLAAWIAEAVEAGLVAVDTETTGLDAAAADLVGICLATRPGRACYVPVGHTGHQGDGGLALEAGDAAPPQIPLARALDLLKPLLEDPSVLKVGQNLKYDYQILARHGIKVAPSDDTMLMSYVLDGGRHGHGMDELADRHLGHRTIAFKEVVGTGKQQITFAQVPLEAALDYAAEDADITLRLHQVLKPRLVRERLTTVYETIERPLVQVVGEMELAGIKVDRGVLEGLSKEFADRMATLEGEIHGLAGHDFNIGSPKQLGVVLFDEMGLPAPKKGKTGAYGTGSEVLEPLAAQGHEIAVKVLDWRGVAKLKSTYTDALQERINPRTGRVHTSFSLAATNTGRLSSNEPNLQNIPIRTEDGRKIRTAFVAEAGHKLISVDYSQIELRLVAEIAGIAALQQAFRDGQDIHALTASQVFGVPMAEMTGEIRRKAKAINFGIIYGISAWGLAAQLGIGQGEASAFIKQYLERFSELKQWMDETKRTCRETGFVTTLFGRRINLPGIKDPNPARRGFGERQAINAPIQGTAADIIKRAMIRLPGALQEAGLSARMLLQVHDELLFEAPEAEAEATAKLVCRVMEGAARLSLPLVAEAGIGDTWGQAH